MGSIPVKISVSENGNETECVFQDSDNKMVKICNTVTIMVLLLLP